MSTACPRGSTGRTPGRRGLLRAGLVAAFAAAAPATAQGQAAGRAAGPPVRNIEVEGHRNLTAEQVRQWFALRPGDPFDPARVSRAVRELTAKRRFADVRVEAEEADGGIVLHVVVAEYPQLAEVRIEGEDKLDEKDIRGALRLAAGSFVAPGDLRADREKVESLYRDKGHYRAVLRDTLLGGTEGGKPVLVWRIAEGPKANVRRVEFVGNEHVPAKTLRKRMQTRQDGFLRGGDLKPDSLQADFDKLAVYYRDRGWLDAQVLRHDLDVGANGRDLTLRIHLQEGRRYTAGTVTWTGNTAFDDEALRRCVKLRQGQPFGETDYEATTAALGELYNDAGYIHFNATPRRDAHDDGTIDLHYVLDEGEVARIHHIRVVGNTKTHDKVILREFLLFPGDTFDRSKLLRSLREVYSLGFFEDANFTSMTPRQDGTVDMELRVAERQTGQLGAGAGYSAVNAVTGFIEVAETNLFGTGNRLSLRWEFSKRQNEVDFSFTQPWLFDTPTSLGIELYSTSRRSRINDFYRDKRTGGALTLGRRLDFLDYSRASWRLEAESVELTDFDASYTGPLRERFADGPRRTVSTGLTLRRDSTDNPFFPSAGSSAEVSSDLTGAFLGGDESYLRTGASLAWFQRIGVSRLALMLRSRFGVLRGLEGRSVPDYERFRLGGNRYYGVRGYDDFEIVPAGNPLFLGGQAMSIFTAEVTYPFSPKVHGVLFFDAGNTWNSFREAELSLLRKGAGVGVRIDVPMLGRLGLDYGYGFDRVDSRGRDRDRWNLHFTFGTLF